MTLKLCLLDKKKTMEASSADWKVFKEYFIDAPNEQNILKSKVLPVLEENSLRMGNRKYWHILI